MFSAGNKCINSKKRMRQTDNHFYKTKPSKTIMKYILKLSCVF
jgi:hypothetical protein